MSFKLGNPYILAIIGFLFIIFSAAFLFSAGGDFDRQEISKYVQKLTQGCTNGGNNPKGFGYSEFPDAYRSWYQVDISAAEIECMKKNGVITMLPVDRREKLTSIGIGNKSRLGKIPEWFKPKEVIAKLGDAYLLSSRDGNRDRYFITVGEFG